MATPEDDNLVLRLLREIRSEQAQHRTLLLQSIDYMRRMEQRLEGRVSAIDTRMNGLRDDLELMIKSELLGALSNREIRIDERIDGIASRIPKS